MSRLTLHLRLSLAAVLIVFPLSSHADILTVRQDGTGQFTTINAAKAVAVNGDVIEVGPGTYHEEIDFSIAVTLRSTDGAANTILDGDEIRRILVFRVGGVGSVVDGFTIREGYHASSGAGLRVQTGATVTVQNCVFEDNYVEFDGGAIVCRDPETTLDVVDCLFVNNVAGRHAAAVVVLLSSAATFTDCQFINNDGSSSGAVASNSLSHLEVTNCVFKDNDGAASAIYCGESPPGTASITRNTFVGNNGTAAVWTHATSVVHRNIFAGQEDHALLTFDATTHTCNVYWNYTFDAIGDDQLSPDEVVADPLFCDPANGVYTISSHSPAAPAQSLCGELIGAYPIDCTIEPPPPPVVGPVILSINDVPNDEGLQVRIRWQRALYDAPQQDYVITGYAVYRRQYDLESRVTVPDAAAGRGKDVAIDGWDYITTVPARGDAIYQVVAPTLCDLKHGNNACYSIFFVSAMTPNPLVFFDSAPDTGQSEDNTPPGQPAALTVDVTAAGVNLAWEPADALDVVEYFVYRTYDSEELGEPVHATANLAWVDPNGSAQARYWVAAVDDAGNVGEAIGSEGPSTDVGPIVPNSYYLGQNAPNPFNPSTTIQFGLPAGAGGNVTIEIFDVAGRRVRSLLNESRGAGTWRVTWDGRTDAGTRASSGVYFYRLRTSNFTQTHRMTLVE